MGKLKEFKRQLLEEIFGLVSEARRREKHKRKHMEEGDDLELITLVEIELELCEPLDKMVFHNKRHRATMLRYRFEETILKARDGIQMRGN